MIVWTGGLAAASDMIAGTGSLAVASDMIAGTGDLAAASDMIVGTGVLDGPSKYVKFAHNHVGTLLSYKFAIQIFCVFTDSRGSEATAR